VSETAVSKAFTLIELIFVLVIIGLLAAVAIPKFTHLSDNAKISSELSTAASVQAAIEACHGEWIVNEGSFTCGKNIDSGNLNSDGYPDIDTLGSQNAPFENLLKNGTNIGWVRDDDNRFYGPASQNGKIRNPDIAGKPDGNDYWEYNATTGTFSLIDVE